MKLNLPIHSYELRSRPASSSRLVNCFPELLPPGARAPILLSRAPGIAAWTTVGSGPIRGMYTAAINAGSELLYVVSGDELYSVNSAGTASLLGNTKTPNRIDMAANTSSVVVVNEPRGFYWDGTTFGEIVDDDFTSRGAGDVEFIDDFLLFREPNSGRFFGADYGSVTSFDALDFAISDSHPDNLVGMKAINRTLVNFGLRSGEIWQNTGAAGFAFERIINGTFEEGCLNSKSIAVQDNTVFWVADDFTVRRLEGITPLRISTHALEQFLSSCTSTSLEAFSYDQDGHFFYVLSAVEGTWVFDVTTGEWAERETYGLGNWTVGYHQQFAGKELVGDRNSNKIGYLDFGTFTEWGTTQRVEWTYQPVFADGQRAFHKRFEVVLESGTGFTQDAQVMMSYSDDGGKTWKAMPDRTMGALGDRHQRVIWHNLGSSRQRVYRCAVSDPIAISITDTLLEVDGGRL